MKEALKVYLVAWLALVLTACSGLGLATAKSPSQDLAYGYATVAGLRQSAATALQSGVITVQEAQTVLVDTDKARTLLDAGEQALQAGDQGAVDTDLQQVTELLAVVQSLLPHQPVASAAK